MRTKQLSAVDGIIARTFAFVAQHHSIWLERFEQRQFEDLSEQLDLLCEFAVPIFEFVGRQIIREKPEPNRWSTSLRSDASPFVRDVVLFYWESWRAPSNILTEISTAFQFLEYGAAPWVTLNRGAYAECAGATLGSRLAEAAVGLNAEYWRDRVPESDPLDCVDRTAEVDQYFARVSAAGGRRLSRKDLWADRGDRKSFFFWQRGQRRKAGRVNCAYFDEILLAQPHLPK